jgi:Na+-transporting NADH:ubiquinone oxidoreductase subunit NqrB
VLRIAVGLALLAWFFVDQSTGFWHYAKLIGIMPLLTGLFSTCPAYTMLGMDTCGMKRN